MVKKSKNQGQWMLLCCVHLFSPAYQSFKEGEQASQTSADLEEAELSDGHDQAVMKRQNKDLP